MDRTDGDDLAPPGRDHVSGGRLCTTEQPGHIQVKRAPELFDGCIGHVRAGERASGIRDKDVEPTMSRGDRVNRRVDLAVGCDVDAVGMRVQSGISHARGGCFAHVEASACDVDVGTEFSQSGRHCAPEVRPAASHQRGLASEIEVAWKLHAFHRLSGLYGRVGSGCRHGSRFMSVNR